ncbi:MAG: response regulator [Fibromonadales bacterium]|nr:response regulator [Fibromonadales bacterium]
MESVAITVLVALNIATIAFFLLYGRKREKAQKEKVKKLLCEKDEQNRIETEQAVYKAKSDFLMKTSNEIRFPLNAIMGFNDLILDKKHLDEDVFENASKIRDSSAALLGIINDILDFSKIESGNLEIVPVKYELTNLINGVISSNIINMESKPIKFNLEIDPDLPGNLFGDEFRLKQIFNNILSNAFKNTKNGNIKWDINFERDGGDLWLISKIQDSGVGIKKEDLKNLFSDSMGLVITKKIINMMGGTIDVESEYGKGSLFTIKIKQQIQSETTIDKKIIDDFKNFDTLASKDERNAKPVYNQMPYATVLLVDDMAWNLEVAQGLMRRYGMKIDTALSGKIAVAKMMNQSTKYSAIFMDYMMPEMDGMEATRRIRELGTEYAKNIPIIALTANALADSEKAFLGSGFNDFMSKPIEAMSLDAILKKWVMAESK